MHSNGSMITWVLLCCITGGKKNMSEQQKDTHVFVDTYSLQAETINTISVSRLSLKTNHTVLLAHKIFYAQFYCATRIVNIKDSLKNPFHPNCVYIVQCMMQKLASNLGVQHIHSDKIMIERTVTHNHKISDNFLAYYFKRSDVANIDQPKGKIALYEWYYPSIRSKFLESETRMISPIEKRNNVSTSVALKNITQVNRE